MAALNYKLASQGMSTGRATSGSLNASLLSSGNAAGRVSSIKVNPNAANVQYSATRPNQIVADTTWSSVANMTAQINDAAFSYIERQQQLEADNLYLEIENDLFELQDGTIDKDGKPVQGYLSASGMDAVKGKASYYEQIEARVGERMGNADSGVKRFAQLRVQNLKNQFKHRGAVHSSRQLKVEEQNTAIREQESLLKIGQKDPDSIFEIDPTTGLSKVDYFVQKRGQGEKDKKQLYHNVVTGVFSKIRYDENLDPLQRYEKADAFFQKNRKSFPAETDNTIAGSMVALKKAAAVEQKRQDDAYMSGVKSNFDATGDNMLFTALTNGPQAASLAAAYRDSNRSIYGDDVEGGEKATVSHLKQALKAAALTDGYEAASDNFIELQNNMRESGKPLLKSVGSISDMETYLTQGLPDELDRIEKSKQRAVDKPVLAQVRGQSEEIRRGIESGDIPIFTDATSVLQDFPDMALQSADSPAVQKERKQSIDNLIEYSQLVNAKERVPNKTQAFSQIRDMYADGKMFETDADFDRFLNKKGVLNTKDRNELKTFRKQQLTAEGNNLSRYTKGIYRSITETYIDPDRWMKAYESGMDIMDVLGNTRIPSEARSLVNQIGAIESNVSIPPLQRTQMMQEAVDKYVTKYPDAGNLSEALNIESFGVKTSEYLKVQEANARAMMVPENNDIYQDAGYTPDDDADVILEPRPISIEDKSKDVYSEVLIRELEREGLNELF